MRIVSVSFKNFASYGNKLQTLDFSETDGMFYLVMGENGAGKSTMSDVIKFGIYGKLGNKRLSDIPNRFNQQTYVKVIMVANNNTITIERGIRPNFLRLFINGEEYDQAGKQNVEDYIADEIIGLPFYVFNNIISLSINDFKSFLNMSPHDKRMIIDKIFSLEIINNAKWLVKEELKTLRDNALTFTKQVETIAQTIANSETELELLKQKIELNAQSKINTIQQSIKEYDALLTDIGTKLTNVDEKLGQSNEKLNGLIELLNKNNVTAKNIAEKKTLYENSKCPMCEADLTTEHHKSILDELINKEIKVNENIEKLQESIKSIRELKAKILTAKNSYSNKQIEFSTIISGYKQQLEQLKDGDKTLETQSIEKIIADNKERRKAIIKKSDKSSQHISFFKIVEEIFGDNGVKQLAINKIMPALNSEIRLVLSELRMDYKVIFDKSFDAHISHLGHEVAIQQLSTGEKKKVDFAVLIAIIRLMKIKYPSINITFLDELFASIDSDGIHHILKILADTTKSMNMNIFVVNHAPLPAEVFDYKIFVSKPNNFSQMDIQKID